MININMTTEIPRQTVLWELEESQVLNLSILVESITNLIREHIGAHSMYTAPLTTKGGTLIQYDTRSSTPPTESSDTTQ